MEDHSARAKRAAVPASVAKLGALTPAFISMDDVARYVHKRIGRKRTAEFGSVILRRLVDGLFLANEPVAGASTSFNWNLLLERDGAAGEYRHPDGFEIVGSLHSHPDNLASTKARNPSLSEPQVKAFISFYSHADVSFNFQDRRRFSVAYLSGPYGTLIKYQPSDTEAEHAYVRWLDSQTFDWNAAEAPDGTAQGFYKKLAALGTLTFLRSTAEWGNSEGQVPADWQPYQAFDAPALPMACGPVFENVAGALDDAASRIVPKLAIRQYLFILEQSLGSRYVASYPYEAPALGETQDTSLPTLPEGWHLDGFYIQSAPLPAEFPAAQAWLYKQFPSPLELATHIAQFRLDAQSMPSSLGVALYVRTPDNAVLSYRFSASAEESRLFAVRNGVVSDNGIQAQLKAGTLLPRDFVLQVARAGELTVEKTSTLWDRAGVVDQHWRAFSKIQAPLVSPPFISADDAAHWAHRLIGPRDVEYGGVILKRGAAFYASHPMPDQRASFDHSRLLATDDEGRFIAPDGYTVEAFYHSHPADAEQTQRMFPEFTDDQVQIFNSFYSVADQRFSIHNRAFTKVHYLSGPDQILLKYVSSGSAQEKTLYRRLGGEEPVEVSTDFEAPIWNLADAGELWLLSASAVWGGVAGRITRGWKIRSPLSRETSPQVQPRFGQQFDRADLAVLDALAGPATNIFGVVLRHTQLQAYAASQPTPLSTPLFALDALLPKRADGQLRLPSQYRLEGIYYRFNPVQPAQIPREPWLYHGFFAPAHVTAAIHQAQASAAVQDNSRGLSLYLLADDDALLRFRLPQAPTDLTAQNVPGVTEDNGAQAALLAGTLSPRGYVRRMLAAGNLEVVRPGRLWLSAGLLDPKHSYLKDRGRVALSPAFLSASDAALYVQDRIGNRDRRYGGYILQGPRQRFFATQPLPAWRNPFAGRLFRDEGSLGPLIPPEGYEIVGRYGSRLELSMSDGHIVQTRGWSRVEAMIDAQMFGVEDIHWVILQGLTGFLMGSAESLLMYTPGGSAAEQRLFQHTSSVVGDSEMARRLADGRLKPATWVTDVAEAGALRVVQASALWGPRSAVYGDWSPNFAYTPPSGPPLSLAYGPLLASADEACLALHAQALGRKWASRSYIAAVLQQEQSGLFITTQWVAVSNEQDEFNLNQLFEAEPQGSPWKLPQGFRLDGVVRSQQWVATGSSGAQAWLEHFFVPAQVLKRAQNLSLSMLDSTRQHGLPIYLSTLEGALLRFRSSRRTPVFGGERTATGLEQTARNLAGGALTAADFIRRVARDSQLTVVRTSPCWDVTGAVGEHWACYKNLGRRRLSPVFASPDDAVRHVQGHLGPHETRAYGGLVLQRSDGLYLATEPAALPPQGFTAHWVFPDEAVNAGLFPSGCTIVGRYRSRLAREVPVLLAAGEKAVYQNTFPTAAVAELLYRDVNLRHDYVLAPDGALLGFSPSRTSASDPLKTSVAVRDPAKADYADNLMELALRDGALTPTQWVNRLRVGGVLSVLNGSAVWGAPRMLTAEFVAAEPIPGPLQVREALIDPACTAVYARIEDAVRAVHRVAGERDALKFSYVLRSKKNGHCLATLPLVRRDYAQLKQVFPNGQLLQGYELKALCLFAGRTNISAPDDDLTGQFFRPDDLVKGCEFLRSFGGNGYLPLYLSCVDGALLKYRFTGQSLHLTPHPDARQIRLFWQQDSTAIVDFIRDLARVGELDVLIGSGVWARRGRLDETWQPRRAAANRRDQLFYGPVFAHTDDAVLHAQASVAPYDGREYLSVLLSRPAPEEVVVLEPHLSPTPAELGRLLQAEGAGGILPVGILGQAERPYRLSDLHVLFKVVGSIQSDDPLDLRLASAFISAAFMKACLQLLKTHTSALSSVYVSTRGGAVLRYIPRGWSDEQDLAAWQLPRPSDYVSRLREAGRLEVIVGDGFWSHPGRVEAHWKQTHVAQALPLVQDDKDVPFWRRREEL